MTITNETPTMSRVVQAALERFAANLHTAMPASIVTYDRTKQQASIQPLLKRRTKDGQVFSFPVVTNVPCVFPRSGDASVTFELKPGDSGMLIVAQRSLDRWLEVGGEVDPQDPRKHDFTDGVFFPGLFPFSEAAPAEQNIYLVQNVNSQFAMTENGRFRAKNLDSGEELVTVLVDLIQQLIDSFIRTGIGPQPFVPSTIAAFEDLKARLETLKE